MTSRLRILGIVVALMGLAFLAASGYTLFRAQEGFTSLNAFSAAQNVQLSYNEEGQLVDRGETAEADAIMALLTDDWGYAVNSGDFDPNDPVVNTASEYMYEMATISYHVLNSTVTVVLDEPVEYEGVTYDAGPHEFAIDGRYYADFDRAHPIEGPARSQAWSPTALGLIGQLGVGTVTASTLQMSLGLVAAFAAVGAALLIVGIGLVWVTRAAVAEAPVLRPITSPTPA